MRSWSLLTARACRWAIDQLGGEHASVLGLARQLGTTWRTVWRSIAPLLQAMADDPARFDGVTTLGVDEHLWHHVDERRRGPRALTGMVDLTRDQGGRTRARLLDLVPGRSGKAYADWLDSRGEAFRRRVQVATLDPFHGYKNAIDDQLVGFALIGVAITVGAVVIVLVSSAPAPASWPFLLASAALHVAYNLLLMRSYRLGEFGQVYPLARGTSPWLVAIAAAVFVGEQLSVLRLVGVLVISLGLGTLVFVGGVPGRAARPAIAAAVLTGVAIAAYTKDRSSCGQYSDHTSM